MQITFLIGNGFDLRLGLKTRFTDMYEEYIASDSSSIIIENFKKLLKADAPQYTTWGDFEVAMAQMANRFSCEGDFVQCIHDFKAHMVKHLKKEQEQFARRQTATPKLFSLSVNETMRSIREFYTGLKPNDVNRLMHLGINIKPDPTYRFISFNYTDTFDNLLDPLEGQVLHIHGKLGSAVVLGVDNLNQIATVPYPITRKFNFAFIKPEFNKNYDNIRLERAQNIIDSSDIICIYGLSLGESDLSWKERIKNWLISSEKNHLVYFVYDKRDFDQSNWDEIMEEERTRISALLKKLGCLEAERIKIFNQIHIPVCYDIFAIDNILREEERKVSEEKAREEEVLRRIANAPKSVG